MSSQLPTEAPPSKNSKNPYQMRFDLLTLARDILEQNAHMAREDKAQDRKTYYTLDEVIDTAQRLNTFVCQR